MNILGIESSCDETAAAVVSDGHILKSSVIASSMDLHKLYGGVVPEIAARSHLEAIMPIIDQALQKSGCSWKDIDTIAVTYGAGLGGSLLIGVLSARTLAIVKNKPLLAINHVQAHVYANFIDQTKLAGYRLNAHQPSFPFLAVIVSGGHSQLVLFKDHSNYQVLGRTLDDAIGEAFDKVAKILGLPYPGGPSIAKLAKSGDASQVSLPIPQMSGYDFSFSGLKTAVLRLAQASVGESYDFPSIMLSERLSGPQKANIAAGFEDTAVKVILSKIKMACEKYKPSCVVLAGGVAANERLRQQLAQSVNTEVLYPDIKLCTDNAAMVASLAYYQNQSSPAADPYTLEIEPSLTM